MGKPQRQVQMELQEVPPQGQDGMSLASTTHSPVPVQVPATSSSHKPKGSRETSVWQVIPALGIQLPPAQVPVGHSPPLLSTQAAPLMGWGGAQPICGLQVLKMQGFPSVQSTTVPGLHEPLTQMSFSVHGLPSSQSLPLVGL